MKVLTLKELSGAISSLYKKTLIKLVNTDNYYAKCAAFTSYYYFPVQVNVSDINSFNFINKARYLDILLNISQSPAHFEALLTASEKKGLNINSTQNLDKIEYTWHYADDTRDDVVINYTRSPLARFIKRVDNSDIEKIKILISHGLDVNFYNKEDLCASRILYSFFVNKNLTSDSMDQLLTSMKAKNFDINFLTKDKIEEVDVSSPSKEFITTNRFFLNDLFTNKELFNIEKIKLLIKHGIDINFYNKNYCTSILESLMICELSKEQKDEVLTLMIEHGLDINQKKLTSFIDHTGKKVEYYESPLFNLLSHGDDKIDVIKLLIKHGIDLNFYDQNNPRTNIEILLQNTSFNTEQKDEILTLMIERGLDINQKKLTSFSSHTGEKVEYYEILPSHILDIISFDIMEILIKHGIDLNFNDKNNPRTNIEILLQNTSFDIEQKDEILTLMIEHGLDINQKKLTSFIDHTGEKVEYYESPLFNLLSYGNDIDVIKLLIKHGIDVNFYDKNNPRTNIEILLQNTSFNTEQKDEILTLMIERGLDINQKKLGSFSNQGGQLIEYYEILPSHIVSNISLDIMQLLIKHGIDVNFKDENAPAFITSFYQHILKHSQKEELLEVLHHNIIVGNVQFDKEKAEGLTTFIVSIAELKASKISLDQLVENYNVLPAEFHQKAKNIFKEYLTHSEYFSGKNYQKVKSDVSEVLIDVMYKNADKQNSLDPNIIDIILGDLNLYDLEDFHKIYVSVHGDNPMDIYSE